MAGGRLGPSRAFFTPTPHWSKPSEHRGQQLDTHAPGMLCFSSLMCLSIASARQKTKCVDEITALRAEGQSRYPQQ